MRISDWSSDVCSADLMMDWTIDYAKLAGYAATPTLFYEFHGTEAGVEEQARMVRDIADEFGGSAFRWTANQEERNHLWQARHDAYYAAIARKPGKIGTASGGDSGGQDC